jgi:hypothetical protein
MAELNVELTYLEELATEQDEAAERLGEAIEAVDGTARKLWFDHGPICFDAVTAMMNAEAERTNACNSMIAVSADLAEKLRAGASAYETTDTQSSKELNREVRRG